MTTSIFDPFALKNGASVPNRLVKAAMEESLATSDHLPGQEIFNLYRQWARGGVGTLITGNVMVHDAAMTGLRDIVLDEKQPLKPFEYWARVAHENGAKIWMQISHPGRQVYANQPGVAWSPSDQKVDVGTKQVEFATPRPMTDDEIHQVIDMFATTARLAAQAGFDGVEIHAAHGYLLSQFLSPRVNTRTDQWGGNLENRARMLREVVTRIRAEVPAEFVVAVKLNSSDFQKGGFSTEDAQQVIAMLADCGADLVELSGGSYESPAMTGNAADSHTRKREAYFLELAEEIVKTSPLPLLVTGGIVRQSVAQQVLDSGVALVGLGTALAADPNLVNEWKQNPSASPKIPHTRIKHKAIASAAAIAWVHWQMDRLAKNKKPQLWIHPLIALVAGQLGMKKQRSEYGEWLSKR